VHRAGNTPRYNDTSVNRAQISFTVEEGGMRVEGSGRGRLCILEYLEIVICDNCLSVL